MLVHRSEVLSASGPRLALTTALCAAGVFSQVRQQLSAGCRAPAAPGVVAERQAVCSGMDSRECPEPRDSRGRHKDDGRDGLRADLRHPGPLPRNKRGTFREPLS